MHKHALVAAIAIVLCTPLVSEAGAKLAKGTLTGSVSPTDISTGACAPVVDANGTDAYDSMCAATNPSDCKCLIASNLTLSSSFGRGTAVLTATEDNSTIVDTASNASGCSPAFAVVTLSINAKGKIPASTQTLNAIGAVCGSPGTTTVNVLGGFSIEGSDSNPAASGSGIFNGTVSTTGQVSIALTGLITNP